MAQMLKLTVTDKSHTTSGRKKKKMYFNTYCLHLKLISHFQNRPVKDGNHERICSLPFGHYIGCNKQAGHPNDCIFTYIQKCLP